MYEFIRKYGNEAGLRAAYDAQPEAVGRLILREIAAIPKAIIDRDYSTRRYVAALRRIVGDPNDPQAEHDRKMKEALAALPDG